jgi:predicted SprT family Zn-dependent metalloprotease
VYADINATFFKNRLIRPTLELSDTTSRLGRWIRRERRLELARTLLVNYGWGAVVEVLKHEMAHQFVDEVLGAVDEGAHGPTFRKICEERGFDARAAGIPTPGDGASNTKRTPR